MAEDNRSAYVVVPRIPTKAMLEAGWYEAHDEDAAGVWRVMVEEWENEKMGHERALEI